MPDTATINTGSGKRREIVFAWSGSASDVTVAYAGQITGWLLGVETIPGSTAPTADYDIVLNNDRGTDLLQGNGADRSATVKQYISAKDSAGNAQPIPITQSKLTLVASNSGAGTGATTQHKAIAHILES